MITTRSEGSRLAGRIRAGVLAAPLLFAALLLPMLAATSGCITQKDIVRLPTLKDVEPTGPEGRKCYDRCSHSEAACRHMCPQNGQLCWDDCEMDTKFCLQDCPELRRP